MIRIEIESDKVHEKAGTSKAGRPYSIREQDAYAWLIDRNGNSERFPTKITLQLENDQRAYAPGNYSILPQSIYVVSEFGKGKLMLGRLQLRAIVAEAKKQA
jgi:hypothetical protein